MVLPAPDGPAELNADLDSPMSMGSTAGSLSMDSVLATDGLDSRWADQAPQPRTVPLQTARSGGSEAPPPSAARVSMPELTAMLRRSASVPHPVAQRAGGAGISAAVVKGRERQAESILELWDLKRTMEQTAKRDKAAREEAVQDKQRQLQLQQQRYQKPVSRQREQRQTSRAAKSRGTAARCVSG
jgi:hypothetical protein